MAEHLLISYPLNRFNMKKYFETFTLAFLVSAGMLAPAGLSAQQRAVKVQGHPHELLTRKAAGGAPVFVGCDCAPCPASGKGGRR
jgi:hypothetical protein